MQSLENAVQQLLDKQALYELAVRLSRGVDRCDRELILSCYHADAYDDHGPYKGGPEGFADVTIAGNKGKFVQHVISNALFEVQGDIAYGEIYTSKKSVDADGELVQGFGRYVDRYERRDGEWRIALRRVITEWVSPKLGFDVRQFLGSAQDRTDPSYERSPQ